MTTEQTSDDNAARRDGSGVERGFRPRALLLAHKDGRETLHPMSEYAVAYRDTAVSEVMLYDRAAIDAAVAAERERWESALGAVMPADFKGWHQNSTMERPAVAAWVIRNLRDREAHLEGVLAEVTKESCVGGQPARVFTGTPCGDAGARAGADDSAPRAHHLNPIPRCKGWHLVGEPRCDWCSWGY